MSRLQNVSQAPDTQALPTLIAATLREAGGRDAASRPVQPETVPFTKAELRQMILEIMG